ncbi:MAG: hypothetical protein GC179_15975 [Anaerolineaceae bacterium]|nr:hypothetical protein [Anaerolineaceae bacterium]
MAKPTPEAEYYLLEFTDLNEAASFVAALSRFFSGTQGNKYLRPAAAAEVWSYIVGEHESVERVEIYMNGPAIKAEKDVFTTYTGIKIRRGNQMPVDCVLLIGAGGGEAWGAEEAEWHMLSER